MMLNCYAKLNPIKTLKTIIHFHCITFWTSPYKILLKRIFLCKFVSPKLFDNFKTRLCYLPSYDDVLAKQDAVFIGSDCIDFYFDALTSEASMTMRSPFSGDLGRDKDNA